MRLNHFVINYLKIFRPPAYRPLDLHFIILIKDIINSFFFFCYFFSFVNNCKFVNNNKKNGVNLPTC